MFTLRAVPKPRHKRVKKTAKERGAVSKAVYAAALERSGGRCERCGWSPGGYDPVRWGLEGAHYMRRHNFGQDGVRDYDIIMLCGPQVNSGTCHHWVDSTREGIEWAKAKREALRIDYEQQAINAIRHS